MQDTKFIPFKASIEAYALPELFTFPFYYQPHPLCLLAAKELQDYLLSQTDWLHNFGLNGEVHNAIGKMFGVLLVKNQHHEIGYLAAFSGKIAGTNQLEKFVPPVFDTLDKGGFFMQGQLEVNTLSEQIKRLADNPQIARLENKLQQQNELALSAIQAHREKMILGRKERKAQRATAETLPSDEGALLIEQLAQQSIAHKNQLRDLNHYWAQQIQKAEDDLTQLTAELNALKQQRKTLSATLQQKLFAEYRFLNKQGELKSLQAIFQQTKQLTPPSAAGECAAPKLLHYAFQQGMQPLAMAEFWWGAAPSSEIRQHKNFYTACLGKCQPILEHMLTGITIEKNPLLNNPAADKSIDIIYADEAMLVINKPAELLSTPGKEIEDSVYFRLRQSYPQATGPLIVHRLDMSTSGLMLIALTKDANKQLQKQFIKRTIKKRYVALLEGEIEQETGLIELPLRLDIDDRPRQLVCYQHGRAAKTEWRVLERKNKQTKILFYPITGRTHQLRVHAAHPKGLNAPIVGDDLYGKTAQRLHLHAEYIAFTHPVTKELMEFQVDAEF
ncbi:MAG: RNA pseudouridine synthase [Methyloprofundus sp.]|nr:RNA pseudouridine synthase [Methyloprofundus sp.]